MLYNSLTILSQVYRQLLDYYYQLAGQHIVPLVVDKEVVICTIENKLSSLILYKRWFAALSMDSLVSSHV